MNRKNNERLENFARSISLILLLVLGLLLVFGNINSKKEISYDKVISLVKSDEIQKIESSKGSLQIKIVLKDGAKRKSVVPDMEEFSGFISKEIESGANIKFVVNPNSTILTQVLDCISQIAVWLVFLAFLPKIMQNMTGGKYEVKPSNSDVRFSDVAGIEEEREQLEEIVEILKNPKKYAANGAKIPKGVILYGAPGTGKTLMAKAVAGEAGVPFFAVTGSSFEEAYVGVGASRIRTLFATARKCAPSIIFIDEIDSLAQRRYEGKSYSEQTLNQLLAEMDGFSNDSNVIVIAATNYLETIDSALLRPGRFDRKVFVPMPDVNAREKILEVHSKGKRFSEISLENIAKRTAGFSGAELENLLNEAALLAVKNGNGVITSIEIEESISRAIGGLEKKNAVISKRDKLLTAVHEAGHAIVSAIVRPEVKNFCISIVPRGRAGGYNFFDEEDSNYQRKSELIAKLKVLYAGRAAEEIILDDISSGASSDFEQARKIAQNMLTKFGMNGQMVVKFAGDTTLDEDEKKELECFLQNIYEESSKIVQDNMRKIIQLANLLINKEYLNSEEIQRFLVEVGIKE